MFAAVQILSLFFPFLISSQQTGEKTPIKLRVYDTKANLNLILYPFFLNHVENQLKSSHQSFFGVSQKMSGISYFRLIFLLTFDKHHSTQEVHPLHVSIPTKSFSRLRVVHMVGPLRLDTNTFLAGTYTITIAQMIATALTTDNIMVKNSVRQRYFSPPWGGFWSFGIFVAVVSKNCLYLSYFALKSLCFLNTDFNLVEL